MEKLNWKSSNINDVVTYDLCTRCGACLGICPIPGAIDTDLRSFPYTTEKCKNCKMCIKVCGGIEVNFPKYTEKLYGEAKDLTTNAIEPLLYSKATYATDKEVRDKSSSGGLASQILISLLEQGEIDGAVVAGYSSENPLQPEARIARSREEVLQCMQSKYTLFPVANVYSEILRVAGRYAVVGLPCQLHSLFRWQELDSRLGKRVAVIIGLFCHANLEKDVIGELARIKKVPSDKVSKLEFRGGKWPGGMRVTLKDGSVLPLHKGDIKDGAFNYLNKLYVAKRCLLCTDYSAELSDIAISDPWLRDKRGEYIFQGGWSMAHVRTDKGSRVISGMEERKEIVAEKVDSSIVLKNNKYFTHFKKRGAFIRIDRLKKKGLPYPNYSLKSPEISLTDRLREYLYQISLIGSYIKPLRRILLKLAFSSFGWQVGRCKAFLKKWKYRLS